MKLKSSCGRLQPPHNGHKKIIDGMKNPIVVIVKGKKSGADLSRNPLDEDYQKKLMNMIFPRLEISISPNGFLPGILGYFRKQGKEVTKIHAGADRITGYQDAIDRANEKMADDEKYRVTFQETERVTSATEVRNSIKSDDKTKFMKLVPEAIWGEWETLKKKISNSIAEGYVKSFGEWLLEEDVTTTDTIKDAKKDMPLFKKILKRKDDSKTK